MKDRLKKWHKITLTILFLLVVSSLYLFIYEPRYSGLIKDWNKTLIIAHRGFGDYAPDNSLSAVKIAIQRDIDGVDLDSQMTIDAELVIFHDPKVDKLTNGTGYVKDKTLAELKALDMGYKFNESFRGERISTFEEILKEINGSAILMVELKATTIKSDGSEQRAIDTIRRNNAYSFVYLSSFNPFTLYRIKKIDKNVRTVFIFQDKNVIGEELREMHPTELEGIPFFLRKEPLRRAIRKITKPDILSINMGVDEKTINDLLRKGYPVFLWPPDSESDIVTNLDKEPYGIVTNEPLRGKELRDKGR